MNKLGIIIHREYTTKVKKKSFLILTLLTPIFLLAIMILPTLLMMSDIGSSDEKVVWVADHTNKYFNHLENRKGYIFKSTQKSVEETMASKDDSFYAYLAIEDDLAENYKGMTLYTEKQTTSELPDMIKNDLTPVVRDAKIASYDIPNLNKILDDTKVRLDINTVKFQKGSDETASASSGVAMVISNISNFMIYFFILTYGSMVFNAVREEKKSRIVEIVVSSAKPFDLMLGKIIAVAMVGFTQILVWAIMIFLGIIILQLTIFNTFTFDPSALSQAAMSAKDTAMAQELVEEVFMPLSSINFTAIIVCFIFYFIGGYILFASLYAAMGSAVDTDEDSNQFIMPITIFFVLALYLGLFSSNNPENVISTISSLVPFTAPIVMMVRLPYDPPLWQIIVSIALVWGTAFLMLWLASRIYRVGILMYGKKPTYKTLIQWLKYK